MPLRSTALTFDQIEAALARISPHVHRTPVLTSSTFDRWASDNSSNRAEKSLFFKCENLQKTGSFKARGATNAILMAAAADAPAGVVTHSSGNHGQAVAWAAGRVAKIPCSVVLPEGTPKVKCDAIRAYGADVVFCAPTPAARKETCASIAAETGKAIIHPYDDYRVMAGQGTIALELHQQVEGLDAILVPTSGGGMLSGIAVATKTVNPRCKIIAVEPEGKELGPCLRAKERLWSNPPRFVDTIAEGIRSQQLGDLTFPIVCDLVEPEVITISDAEMAQGMRLVAERMKLIVEAAAGASVAAALLSKQLDEKFPGLKRIGVVLCGGNTDLDLLPWKS